jgi:methanogenic corrinoid protein MtbC1
MERQAPEKRNRLLEETSGSPVEVDCWQDAAWQPPSAKAAAQAPRDASGASHPHDRVMRLVKTLEEQIIPRLVDAHRAMSDAAPLARVASPLPDAAEIKSFVDLVMARDDAPVFARVADLQAAGLSVEAIYLDLLAPAAQRLGEMWDDDRADFTEVTVGVGRLQHVLRELSPAFGTEVEHPQEGRRVLLVPAPGEQHTFGLSMVSEFFHRAGWDVTVGEGGSRTQAIDLVQREWFDVIGFSVGSEARLDWLRSGITSVREHSRNRSIGVLVGGPVFKLNPDYVHQVGADATAIDGLQAPICAEALVSQRARHPLKP